MRILGFSQKWPKLNDLEFTTFRYPRKDSDRGQGWSVGEPVQIVYHPRHEHKILGEAVIKELRLREVGNITDEEAVKDGFENARELVRFLKPKSPNMIIHKLTIKWSARRKP